MTFTDKPVLDMQLHVQLIKGVMKLDVAITLLESHETRGTRLSFARCQAVRQEQWLIFWQIHIIGACRVVRME